MAGEKRGFCENSATNFLRKFKRKVIFRRKIAVGIFAENLSVRRDLSGDAR